MEELRKKAKALLEAKSVSMVIGYEEGTAGIARPAFIMDASMTDKLIYDKRCIHNLALYLTKKEIKRAGKIAIVAPMPVMKSIIVLATENQVTENNLVVLGVCEQPTNSPLERGERGVSDELRTTNYELIQFENFAAIESYITEHPETYRAKDKELLDRIDKMNATERWDYWQSELSKCIKCYACRGACPMCYCGTCTVDCNQPQWISVPSHEIGNLEWHLMRAMHLAGRCINCGQCADSCPLDIPVNILTLKISEDILKNFNYKAGTNLQQDYVLSTFNPNDKDSFIN